MKKIYYFFSIVVVMMLIGIIYVSVCTPKKTKGDLILKNGTFFTVDNNNTVAQAVVIKDNHILFVGKDENALKYAGEHTEIIDLQDQFGCPGFNDANVNLLTSARFNNALDLSNVTTTHIIQRKVLRKIWDNDNYDEWIIAKGWDQTRLNTDDWPDRRILDRIAPYVPMILFNDDGHVALVNSKTLRMVRIWSSTEDPPGGEILKDPRTGNTTGILKDRAIDLVEQFLPEIPKDSIRQVLEQHIQQAVKLGITSLQDKSSPDIAPFIKELQEQNLCKCRISLSYPLKKEIGDYITLKNDYSKYNIDITPLTITIDGSIKSRTALLSAPYADKSSTNGISQIAFEQLCELIIFADRNDLPVEIHAAGDAAVYTAVQAFDFVHTVNKIKTRRFRCEGIEVINPTIIERLKELNIVAVMNPNRCMDAMRWMDTKLGPRRIKYAYAFASLLKNGSELAFGSGYPHGMLNPLFGIYTAVTRKDTTGHPSDGWIPNERLTVQEAIRAYTLGSAYAEGKENEKGSLEPGKLADIVILDRNILDIPYQDILNAQVDYTIINGKIVYEREGKKLTL